MIGEQIRAEKDVFEEGIRILLFQKNEDGRRLVAQPIEYKLRDVRDAGCYTEPTLIMNETFAQQLIDDLWRCGLRPTEGKGSAGSLAATQRHLEDMRSIVSKNLNVEMK